MSKNENKNDKSVIRLAFAIFFGVVVIFFLITYFLGKQSFVETLKFNLLLWGFFIVLALLYICIEILISGSLDIFKDRFIKSEPIKMFLIITSPIITPAIFLFFALKFNWTHDIYSNITHSLLLTAAYLFYWGVILFVIGAIIKFIKCLFHPSEKKHLGHMWFDLFSGWYVNSTSKDIKGNILLTLFIVSLMFTIFTFSNNNFVHLLGCYDVDTLSPGTYSYYVKATSQKGKTYTLPAKVIIHDEGGYSIKNVYFKNGGYLYFATDDPVSLSETFSAEDQSEREWDIKLTNKTVKTNKFKVSSLYRTESILRYALYNLCLLVQIIRLFHYYRIWKKEKLLEHIEK